MFELVFIGGKGIVLRVKGCLAVEGEHSQHWIGLHHGVKQHYHICCYVDLSTGFERFLKNDTERCFSLVFPIFLFLVVRSGFLSMLLVRGKLVRLAVRRRIRHGHAWKSVFSYVELT